MMNVNTLVSARMPAQGHTNVMKGMYEVVVVCYVKSVYLNT